jgi:hypothetical protein
MNPLVVITVLGLAGLMVWAGSAANQSPEPPNYIKLFIESLKAQGNVVYFDQMYMPMQQVSAPGIYISQSNKIVYVTNPSNQLVKDVAMTANLQALEATGEQRV